MGIFSGLFKSRDKLQDRTAGSNYAFFFGSTTSGKSVTERSAMQMTAVYACIRILSEAVAGLPVHLYRYTSDGGKEKAVEYPLYLLLHDEPNPEMSYFVFRKTLMTHLLLWGNAYAQIIRTERMRSWRCTRLCRTRCRWTETKTGGCTTPITVARMKPSGIRSSP